MLRVLRGVWAAFNGFWLGVLSRSALEAVDDLYYTGRGDRQYSSVNYSDPTYNERGLYSWEQDIIATHFDPPGPIGVAGAGGGREVLALRRLGYTVDGWECQKQFVESANELLVRHGFEGTVSWAPKNQIGDSTGPYNGFIVGWGMYTLIHTRAERVALLRMIQSRMNDGAPLLISYFFRGPSNRTYELTAMTANVIRRATLRPPVALGDSLEPNLVHYFTHEELSAELAAGGFHPVLHRTQGYAHTVSLAVTGS